MTTFAPDELASIEHALERAARIERAARDVVDHWDSNTWECSPVYVNFLECELESRE